MIKLNDGTILRNLEEQVRENKEQIALHWNVDRVLADFGIHVRGTLPSKAALDQVPTADLQYGDAYFIGTAEPYDVWIWTRPDANAGEEEPYWLDIGHIAIEGPQGPMGPQGPQGPQGERGTTWYTGSSVSGTGKKDGDLWLYTGDNAETKGNIYKWSAASGSWVLITNVIGPQGIQGIQGPQGPRGEQGPQGIQGPRGDSGRFINVRGILTDSNQLPTPASISDLSAAYLIGTAAPYDLYIQVGESIASAVWTNSGPFNVGTLVSVNGEYVNMWDADTKVDKVTTVTTRQQVYVKAPGGSQEMVTLSTDFLSNGIPRYNEHGRLTCADPTSAYNTINKAYADANYIKVPAYGNATGAIIRYSDGSTTGVNVAAAGQVSTSTIPRYSSTGTLAANNPVNATDVVNKQYGEANYVPVPALSGPGRYRVTGMGKNSAGDLLTTSIDIANYGTTPTNQAFPRGSSDGNLTVAYPKTASDAATKQYVDNLIRKPVTIYLNLGSGSGSIAAGVLGISAQLTPAEITALKAGIASDAEDMTPRITALFNYMDNNNYTLDYLALPVNGNIATTNNTYYLSGGIHRNGTTTLKIRSGFGSEQQEPQYLEVPQASISRVRLIVHIPNDPDDESP